MDVIPSADRESAIPDRPAPPSVARRILDIAQQMRTDPTRTGPFFYDERVVGARLGPGIAECSQQVAEYLSRFKGDYKRAVENLVGEGVFHPLVLGRLEIVAYAPMFLVESEGQQYHGADIENGFVVLKNMRNELSGAHELTHLLLPGIDMHMVNEGFQQVVANIIYGQMTQWRQAGREGSLPFYTAHENLFWETVRLSGYSFKEWMQICTSADTAANTRHLLHNMVHVNGIWGGLEGHLRYLEEDYAKKLLPHGPEAIASLSTAGFQGDIARHIHDDLIQAPTVFAYNEDYARTSRSRDSP